MSRKGVIRPGLSIGLLLLLLAVVSGVGYWGVRSISATTVRLLREDAHVLAHAARARADVLQMRRFEKDVFLNVADAGKVGEYHAQWIESRKQLDRRIAELEIHAETAGEKGKIKAIRENLRGYAAGFERVYALIREGRITTPVAANAAMASHKGMAREIERAVSEFASAGNDRMDAVEPLVESRSRWTAAVIAALTLAAALVIRGVRNTERGLVRMNDELTRSRERLRALAREIQSAREEERARIAREIHDVVGQDLTVITLEVAALEKRLPPEAAALRAKARSLKASVDAAIVSVQRISAELRPRVLDHLGIAAAVAWQAKTFGERAGIACAVSHPEREFDLDKERATALFRVFQEALTNVARHSGADRVEVELSGEGGAVVLRVEDNGKGISGDRIDSPESLGLMGMRERMRPFGGEVRIESEEGAGTRLTVRVPAPREAGVA